MCRFCGYEDFLEELGALLRDSDYEWAEDTISGIHETVTEKEHVTKRQREAIENITDAVERRR